MKKYKNFFLTATLSISFFGIVATTISSCSSSNDHKHDDLWKDDIDLNERDASSFINDNISNSLYLNSLLMHPIDGYQISNVINSDDLPDSQFQSLHELEKFEVNAKKIPNVFTYKEKLLEINTSIHDYITKHPNKLYAFSNVYLKDKKQETIKLLEITNTSSDLKRLADAFSNDWSLDTHFEKGSDASQYYGAVNFASFDHIKTQYHAMNNYTDAQRMGGGNGLWTSSAFNSKYGEESIVGDNFDTKTKFTLGKNSFINKDFRDKKISIIMEPFVNYKNHKLDVSLTYYKGGQRRCGTRAQVLNPTEIYKNVVELDSLPNEGTKGETTNAIDLSKYNKNKQREILNKLIHELIEWTKSPIITSGLDLLSSFIPTLKDLTENLLSIINLVNKYGFNKEASIRLTDSQVAKILDAVSKSSIIDVNTFLKIGNDFKYDDFALDYGRLSSPTSITVNNQRKDYYDQRKYSLTHIDCDRYNEYFLEPLQSENGSWSGLYHKGGSMLFIYSLINGFYSSKDVIVSIVQENHPNAILENKDSKMNQFINYLLEYLHKNQLLNEKRGINYIINNLDSFKLTLGTAYASKKINFNDIMEIVNRLVDLPSDVINSLFNLAGLNFGNALSQLLPRVLRLTFSNNGFFAYLFTFGKSAHVFDTSKTKEDFFISILSLFTSKSNSIDKNNLFLKTMKETTFAKNWVQLLKQKNILSDDENFFDLMDSLIKYFVKKTGSLDDLILGGLHDEVWTNTDRDAIFNTIDYQWVSSTFNQLFTKEYKAFTQDKFTKFKNDIWKEIMSLFQEIE